MSRQAVIETGSYSVKAGLWEQTFVPTVRIPSFCCLDKDGRRVWGKEALTEDNSSIKQPIVDEKVVNFDLLEELWYKYYCY